MLGSHKKIVETNMNEIQYKRKLIKKLRELLPGCFVLQPDPRHLQGLPDIIILYNDTWAMLEIKISEDANVQPNQDYYVKMFGNMSFASFINPGNEEEVLSDLQQTFGSRRSTRLLKS